MNADHELWAWVTEDHNGRVSFVGTLVPGVGTTPLISHNVEMAEQFETIAKDHGLALGQPVWLRRYVVAEDIGMITAKLRMRN